MRAQTVIATDSNIDGDDSLRAIDIGVPHVDIDSAIDDADYPKKSLIQLVLQHERSNHAAAPRVASTAPKLPLREGSAGPTRETLKKKLRQPQHHEAGIAAPLPKSISLLVDAEETGEYCLRRWPTRTVSSRPSDLFPVMCEPFNTSVSGHGLQLTQSALGC